MAFYIVFFGINGFVGRIPQRAADSDGIIVPEIPADFSDNHGDCISREFHIQRGVKIVNGLYQAYAANLK